MDYRLALQDIFTHLNPEHPHPNYPRSPDAFLSSLCSFACSHLHCTRWSYWHQDSNESTYVNHYLYDQNAQQHSQGQRWDMNVYQPFFLELAHGGLICSFDSQVHPATACLYQNYSVPLQIQSMLTVSVTHQTQMVGFLLAEQCFEYKRWSTQDINFMVYLSLLCTRYYWELLDHLHTQKLP